METAETRNHVTGEYEARNNQNSVENEAVNEVHQVNGDVPQARNWPLIQEPVTGTTYQSVERIENAVGNETEQYMVTGDSQIRNTPDLQNGDREHRDVQAGLQENEQEEEERGREQLATEHDVPVGMALPYLQMEQTPQYNIQGQAPITQRPRQNIQGYVPVTQISPHGVQRCSPVVQIPPLSVNGYPPMPQTRPHNIQGYLPMGPISLHNIQRYPSMARAPIHSIQHYPPVLQFSPYSIQGYGPASALHNFQGNAPATPTPQYSVQAYTTPLVQEQVQCAEGFAPMTFVYPPPTHPTAIPPQATVILFGYPYRPIGRVLLPPYNIPPM